MANQVIVIDRKKYAVGLFWQPVAVGFVPRNYARTLVRGVDKKLNLYTEYRAMVALGSRRAGHRVVMPAAAAEVMEAFAEFSSFLAAFNVQGLFWLVAVRNGIIIRDKLFETEEDARQEYLELSSMPDWGSMFAPGTWGMPRSVERNLHDIVSGNVRATLRPVSNFKTDLTALVLLLVFAFGVAYFFREPIVQMITPKPQVASIDPILAAEYKKRIDEKNQELDRQFNIVKVVEPEQPTMPYDYLPDTGERASVCYQAIGFLMQPIAGWVQTDVECMETHANVIFKRNFGSLADFYEQAAILMPGAFVQERGDSEMFMRAKLPELDVSSSMDERDAGTIIREVNTAFQKIDAPVDTNIAVDVIGDDMQSVALHVVEVSAESKLIPTEFMKIFDGFDGVYMTRVAWNAATKTWNYEVIIYAK